MTIRRGANPASAVVFAPINLASVSGVITPRAALGYGPHRHIATTNVQLAAPTGGTDGEPIEVQVYASGGDRTLTIAGVPQTIPSGTTWWGHFSYVAARDEWLLDDSSGGGVGGALSDGSVTNATVASNAAISADKLVDGTTNKIMVAAERTKLSGLPTNADGRFNIKDYGAVGNGTTDDNTAIQNALNAASAAGSGTVFVPRSTGSFIFTALDIPSNVTFLGLGGTLKLKDNTTTAAIAYYPILISARTNTHLVDLIIDGNSANNPGDNVNTVSDAVTMVSCSNSSIRGCTISNAPDSGIMFSRCTNSRLLNNTVDTTRDTGVYVNDGDGTLFSECLVQGNIFINCFYGGIALKRLLQRVIVANNTIKDCGNGITLEHITGTDFSTNMTITGNRIKHTGFNTGGTSGTPAGIGIDLRGGQYVVCSGNHIEDVAAFGVKIEGGKYNTVSSNVVIQTPTQGQAAFVCWERSEITTGAQHNTFVGNVAIGGPTAFWISGVSGKASDNTTLIGNHAIQADSIGLRVDQFVTNLTLIGNVFGGGTTDVNINASAGVIYPLHNRLLNGTISGTFNQIGTVKLMAVATGSRPSATTVGAGTTMYDTTLSKPIWSNGTVWKDSAGTTV